MKNSTLRLDLFYIFFSLGFLSLNGQSSGIIDAYETYTEAPREIAYVHLNKSTFIEGEIMGLTAYVFDKYTKELSKATSNLYCTISNENGEVIKKKLIKVDNGISSNVFDIDSTLSTGVFTFKAFTNWMRNFDEQNHYEQTFKVIDADNLGEIRPVSFDKNEIDLQVLGEGGHIVYNTINSVGVIAKNQFGYGISNAFGTITDTNENIVSEFQLNESGLGKTLFTPLSNQTYSVNLLLEGGNISRPIKEIKSLGIAMSLVSIKDRISIKLSANKNTIPQLQNETFNIALHNGSEMALTQFKFNKDGIAILTFPKEELFKGTNIFTVFNQKNKPILERLYFNINDIYKHQLSKLDVEYTKDSVTINLNLQELNTSKFSNLSVSVLPSDTKSYNHHNNLLSQLYIQPYINGKLEKGSQYFLANDRKSEFYRDLLMLTQGWSSYDWNDIFSTTKREYLYPFERGIDIIANVNNNKAGSYVVYPLADNNTQLFEVPTGEKVFTIKKSFPTDDDLFRVGYINTKKKEFKEKPSLYLQYYPSKFPIFNNNFGVIDEVYTVSDKAILPSQLTKAWGNNSKYVELDEVTIQADQKKTRLESLKNKAINSRVDIIEENIKLRNLRLDLYLQRKGWTTQFDYFSGTLSITNPRVNWGNPVPLVYLDNALLTTAGVNSDFSILTFLNMQDIEYIEDELYGIGGGIRGGAGFIKIYTDPNRSSPKRIDNTSTYDVPLKFDSEKKFYTSKYQYYNTDFFKEYGTIDWKPKVKINETGIATIKILDTQTQNITLFIEGVVNDNEYISKQINIEKKN